MVTLWKSSTTPIAERCSPHHAICLLSYFITLIVKSSKRKLFLTVWFNSLGKYAKMRLSEVHIFIGQKTILFCRKDPQTLFKDHFCPKTENERTAIFRPKSQFNPFGKYAKLLPSKVQIFIGQKSFFSVEKIPKHFVKIYSFAKKQKYGKKCLFDQHHRLTSLENIQKIRLSEVHIFIGL